MTTTFTDALFNVSHRHLPKLLGSSSVISCEHNFDEGSLLFLTKLCKKLYYKYFDKPLNGRFFEETIHDGGHGGLKAKLKYLMERDADANALARLDEGWLARGLGVEYIDFLEIAQFCAASWKFRRGEMDRKFTVDDLLVASIRVIDLLLEVSKRAIEISEGFTVRVNSTLRACGLVFQVASILPPQHLSDLAGLRGFTNLTATLGTQKGIQNDCQQNGKIRRPVIHSPFSIDKYFNDELTNVSRNFLNMISAGKNLGGATSEWAVNSGNAAKIYQRSGMGDGMASKELEEAKVMAAKIEVGRSLLNQAAKNISISWLGFTPDINTTAEATRIKNRIKNLKEEDDQLIFYPNDFMVLNQTNDDVVLTFADKMVDLMYDFYSAIISEISMENEWREQAKINNTLNLDAPGSAAGIDDKVGDIPPESILLILNQIYGIDIVNEKDPLRAIITNQQPGKCRNSKTGEKSGTEGKGKTKGGKDNNNNKAEENLDLLRDVDIVNSYFSTNYEKEDQDGHRDRPRISQGAMMKLKSADNGIPPSFYDENSKYKYDFCPAFAQDKKSKSDKNGRIGDEDGKGYVKNTFILDAVRDYMKVNENIDWVLSHESCTRLVDVTGYLVCYLSYDLAIKTVRFTHCRIEMDKLEQGKPLAYYDYSLYNITPSDVETAHAAIIRNTFLGTTCLSKKSRRKRAVI